MAALPQILSSSAIEQFQRLSQRSKTVLNKLTRLDSKIPADLKAQIQKAIDGIKDGSIQLDLPHSVK